MTFKQSLFIKGPVRILNATPFDFPPEFLKALEEDFGQKIEVRRSRDWDDIQAKMVTKTGPHLILAPGFWAEDFSRENLILDLEPVQKKIEKRLSPDFISLQGGRRNMLPLYWTVTEFRVHKDSPLGETLEQALTSKNLEEIHLYPDKDLMSVHLKAWETNPAIGALKLKDIDSYHYRSLPAELSKTSVWEVPQLAEIPNSRALQSAKSKALVIYGLMIPQNSQNPKASYRLMERLMDAEIESIALHTLPLGSALQDTGVSLTIKKAQRSSELRDLKLHEVLIQEKREPELFQKLWQKYNFVN